MFIFYEKNFRDIDFGFIHKYTFPNLKNIPK